MKLIFLDIDGVLNNEVFYLERAGEMGNAETQKRAQESRHYNICPRCIEMLNLMLQQNDAHIVITSSWRSDGDIEYWRKFMGNLGVWEADKRIIGITPYLYFNVTKDHVMEKNRSEEIWKWIKDNEDWLNLFYYNGYVILDDDFVTAIYPGGHYIEIDPFCGLTPLTVQKVNKIFNNPEINKWYA